MDTKHKILFVCTGTKEEILQHTREVRDQIEQQIKAFVQEASPLSYGLQ